MKRTPASPAWPVLKSYDEQHLLRVAMPIGGIGTGTVSLGGRGDLRDWEIMNRAAKGYMPKSNAYPFFAIFAKAPGSPGLARGLEGPLDPVEYEGAQGCRTPNHGLPRFRHCTFRSAYPLTQVELADDSMPISVRLEAFNPLIPGDAERSGIPVAVLRYVVRNTTPKPLTVAVCGSLPNFIGADGSQLNRAWNGGWDVSGSRANRNHVRTGNGVQGLFMTSESLDRKDAAWGTMALTTSATSGVTCRTAWAARSWGDSLLDFWDDFSADGALEEREVEGNNSPMASLAVRFKLAPRAEKTVTFLLTWHFPNRYTWTPSTPPNPDGAVTGPGTTGFANSLDVSAFQPGTGDVTTLTYPADGAALRFATRRFRQAFASLRPDVEKHGNARGCFYLRHRFSCDEAMNLTALLGYDGPCKAWLDGRELFCDPAGTNPSAPGDARLPFAAAKGAHELLVALNTNAGKAWGIFLQYQRTDISRHALQLAGGKLRLPRFTTETADACGCAGGCDSNPDLIGNYYTTRYADAWDVAERTVRDLPQLEKDTVAFVRAFCASPLPDVVKEAALFNVSTLRSQTCFRTPDGNFYGWEGCNDHCGCCHGSCTHVWNYEFALAHLFGDLAWRMRDVEFGHCTADNGHMCFRVNLPLTNATGFGHAAADGQMGCLMKLYREWQLSGDEARLRQLWPKARKAIEFCWIEGGWDGDRDGVMEGCQHNTMDVEYYGPNPQMQGWYLGALRAGEEMARHVGDPTFADCCRSLFEKGSAWMDKHLFNGDYYEHEVRPPRQNTIAAGLRVGMGTTDVDNPALQLGAGCLVDQLVGQYFAHAAGLGYLHDQAHVRQTLRSIMAYNFKRDFSAHFNHMRSYVLGNESALLMATYPKGRRPERPFPYYNEVMTGFEYTAGVHMLYEGQEKDGLTVIKAIRDRYDGKKRSPFDEAECGHHYARAMASWAAILALTGFHYSAVEQRLQFGALPAGKPVFWSTGHAWGTCELRKQGRKTALELTVCGGAITVKTLCLGSRNDIALPAPRTLTAGRSTVFSI